MEHGRPCGDNEQSLPPRSHKKDNNKYDAEYAWDSKWSNEGKESRHGSVQRDRLPAKAAATTKANGDISPSASPNAISAFIPECIRVILNKCPIKPLDLLWIGAYFAEERKDRRELEFEIEEMEWDLRKRIFEADAAK